MEVDPANQKACRCKGTQKYSYTLSSCYCPTGYYDGSTCQSCTTLCSTCDSTKCLTCQGIANLIVDPQNPTNCVCASGYNWITATGKCDQCSVGTYYDGNKCASCSDNCASCYNGSGFCGVCKDSRMMISTSEPAKCICKGTQKLTGSTCSCDAGYYFDGSTCVQCSSLCSSCSDYTGECKTCKDSKMTIDAANKKNCICIGDQILNNNMCTCPGSKQFNGAGCSDCSTFCSNCNVGSNTCNICLDGTRMSPVSNTLTCACKGNQIVTNAGCSCPSGSYFDSSTCSTCGDFCTTCTDISGVCTACKDSKMEVNPTNQKVCRCKGTQQYSYTLSSCYCPTGYYDGSTCQSCTTLCSTCDSTKCLTCQGIANLIVDPQNPTNCVCASGYNWITESGKCDQCSVGTYYDGNKCAACSDNCASCYDRTGYCKACNSRFTPSTINPAKCICKGTQKLIGSTCSCDAGYYFDGDTCVQCSDLCSTCEDLTGVCKTCKDSKLMTFDSNNNKKCKCIGDQILSGDTCSCPSNKQFNGLGCSSCGEFCSACDVNNIVCNTCLDGSKMSPVSNTLTCACKGNQLKTNTGCTCPSGSYFDSTTCSTCGDFCTTCTDTTGICTVCKDSKMEVDPANQKACRCKGTQKYSTVLSSCYCPTGYFDGSTCQSCTTLCSTCDSTKCLTCQGIANLIVDPQNPTNCVCASGYNWITATGKCDQCSVGTYYDGSKCASCSDNCASCYNGSGFCGVCKDSRMMISTSEPAKCICKGTQKLTGSTCSCDAGYYFDGSTCVQCSSLCSSCSDYTGECKTCKDSKMTIDAANKKNCICIGDQILNNNMCTCPGSKQFNGSGCSDCSTFCSNCNVGSTTCNICLDGTRMSPVSNTLTCACKGNQIVTNAGCSCPSGSYFDSSTCSTCGDFCTTCTDISGVCTACKSDKMEVNPTNQKVCRCKGTQQYSYTLSSCYCPTGYYDGSTCQSCTTLCSTCDSTKCLTCQGIANLIVDPQNPTNCVCASGYNWITESGKCDQCSVGTYYDGNKCAACSDNCASCYDRTGLCKACKSRFTPSLVDPTKCICKGTQKLIGSTCSCDAGYYFDGDTCVQCSDLCSTCEDLTGVCKTCKDSKLMTFDSNNNKKCKCIGDQILSGDTCSCPSNKQFNGLGCSSCGEFCSACDVNNIVCNTCLDGSKMSPVSITLTCACKGNQLKTNTGCTCPSGSYFDSTTCSTCGDFCTTCTDTTGICTVCKDSKMEVDPANQKACRCKGTQKYSTVLSSCYCPTGYFDGSTCQSCTTLCSTCDSTKCLTCQGIANLILDPQNPSNCVCATGYNWITATGKCDQCSVGTYYDGSKCASCSDNCASCYNGSGFCAICKDSRMMISTSEPAKCICKGTQKLTGSTCSCDAGYYFDGSTCVQCSSLCSSCSDYTGECKTCKDSKMTIDPTNKKNCICIGDQILNNNMCTCPGSKQFNGAGCSDCSTFCSNCNVGSNTCNICLDGNKMSPVSNTLTCACKGNQIVTNAGCSCPSGSYFDSSTCSTCGDLCTTCTDTTGVCTACKSDKMEVDPTNQKVCRCKGTQQYNTVTSSCYCPTGYYDDSTCQSCTTLCSTCDSTKCLTCQGIANLIVDPQNPTNCVCASGYNWITASSSCEQCSVGTYYDGKKCDNCAANCASCYNGSGICKICKDPNRMDLSGTTCTCKGTQKLTGSTCSCDAGYYFDGSTCVQCSSLCSSCSDYTGECKTCKDSKMTIDSANKKNCICIGDQVLNNNMCTCPGSKQFNGAGCSDCSTFCSNCNVGSNTCNICLDGNRMSPVSNTLTCACKGNQIATNAGCSCPAGSYFDSSTCSTCGDLCTTCTDTTGICTVCKDSKMEVNPTNQKVCRCKGTQQYNTVTSSCYCPTGYYDGSTCQSCTTLCSTCDSTKCLTCQGIANLIVDPQNPTNCVCASGYNWITESGKCEQCSVGTYYDGNKCAVCSDNCASCYDRTGYCKACNSRFTPSTINPAKCICKGTQKLIGSTCSCDAGYYFDGDTCVQCSDLCSTCEDLTGVCKTCKDSKLMTFDSNDNKKCKCIGNQSS
ncbi:unnamed protein product [Blepharisma stoltei]|uniref:EGF-like domain-containing protein n=1 Tax=Blepharisma stoltei TaxID=1481888 RepID=A0AAU9JG21_9CILI|nr:unnamed protein product [Blepharisma stoltei]